MSKYTGKQVPFPSFQNSCGQIIHPNGIFTYAFGNTSGQPLAERFATRKGRHLNLLMLGSGDLRNVFFTLSELWQRKPSLRPGQVNFHVNDFDPVVVARNVIILEIARCIDPERPEDIDFLWNIWYNLALSEDHYQRLQQFIKVLISNGIQDREKVRFENEEDLRECGEIWRDWASLSRTVEDVRLERKKFIIQKTAKVCGFAKEKSDPSVSESREELKKRIESLMFDVYGNLFPVVKTNAVDEKLEREIQNFYLTGSTSSAADKVNPTLLRPVSHAWRVHYGSHVFQGYIPLEREMVEEYGSITDACKAVLKEKIIDFQTFFLSKRSKTSIEVTFSLRDALELCTSFKQAEKFDIIDTSNLADHLGLLNILVCCAGRLKCPNQSMLLTSTMVWGRATSSIDEYLNESVGVDSRLLPTTLGLKLADDLQLGRGTLRHVSSLIDKSHNEMLTWVKADQGRTPVSMGKSDDVVAAFQDLARRCFLLPFRTAAEFEKSTFGIGLSSPTMFLRILQQAAPALKETVPVLLARVLDCLPKAQLASKSMCQPLFILSWNVVKHVLEGSKDGVFEVQVKVDLPITRSMPIAAFLFENPADAAFVNVFTVLTGITSPTYRGRVHLLANNVRYNTDTNHLTFHVLEQDWTDLPDCTILMVSDMTIAVRSVPVQVKSTATTVHPIDIKEVYGLENLVAVVPRETKSDALEIIFLAESTLGYTAELKTIGVNLLAGSLGTRFVPKDYPTSVEISLSGSCTKLFFSSPVEEQFSKLKISRKQGKIFCEFPKKTMGLVGESCIQNPAQLVMEELPCWNSSEDHFSFIMKLMFSTKSSMAMRKDFTIGKDPFHDLRETLLSIIKQYVYFGQERNVYKVYDPADSNSEAHITIIVQGVYKYKFMPMVKVMFSNGEEMQSLAKRSPSMKPFLVKTYDSVFYEAVGRKIGIQGIKATQKELVLLKRLLYTNASRLEQAAGLIPVWKQSFLHPRFPREKFDIFRNDEGPGSNRGSMEGGVVGLVDVPKQVFTRDADCDAGIPCSAQTLSDSSTKKCASCHKVSHEVKKCSGCSVVYYCDRDCQRNHWKIHRNFCKTKK